VFEVVEVIAQTLDKKTPLQGELWAYESVAIHARAAGFVEAIPVDRGTRVRKGQLLARISAPELSAQRAEAEAKVKGSRSTVERLTAASKVPGVVAGHDLELAEATLQAEEARARSLRTMESYLVLRAPFDGVVSERSVHPGALVGPSTGPLLRIEQIDRLRLTVAVPEQDVGTIAEGARADFGVPAWPAHRFFGVIQRVSHRIDARTRTMPVELDVDNRQGKLAAGMFAEVAWPLRRDAPSLFVPPGAVVQSPEATFVDRVQDGVIARVPVKRGALLKHSLEVFGELHAGDVVLARGSEELAEGARVQTKRRVVQAPPGEQRPR
jgi:RND family efflux transporter MFP subunit